MKKIDFFKKGYIDFFLYYYIAFSKVQSDIFTDKSHSTLKRNPKVSLEGRVKDIAFAIGPSSFDDRFLIYLLLSPFVDFLFFPSRPAPA